MQRTLILLPIFLLIIMACYGSNFRNYQVDDGLSHNSVWYVMQDSDGFMWFGTNDGLTDLTVSTLRSTNTILMIQHL